MKSLLAWAKQISPNALLLVFFFALYLFTMSGSIRFGDESEKYRVAQSIVERGDLAIRPTVMRSNIGVGGRSYSSYELGQTLLEVPFYLIGKIALRFFPTPDPNWLTELFVGLLNPLITALTVVLLFQTGRLLGYRTRTALALAGAFGFATIAFPYSRSFTREPLLSLLILFSIYAVFQFEQSYKARWLLVTGSATGYLAFSKLIHGVVIPILLVYIVWVIVQTQRRAGIKPRAIGLAVLRGLVVFLLPAILFLVAQSVYAFARYSSPVAGLGGIKTDPASWVWMLIGLSEPLTATWGLLFSADKSLWLYSPPTILFGIALVYWWRQSPRQTALLLVLVLVEFLSVILRPDWDGGTWWGPRYLVQITPLLMLPIGILFESATRRARAIWISVFGGLSAMGLGVQIFGAFTNERDALDLAGQMSTLTVQFNYLSHGVVDSLLINWAPGSSLPQVNPFTFVLLGVLGLSGAMLIGRSTRNQATGAVWPSALFVLFMGFVQAVGLIVWIVAPYPQVLAAKANTRLVAAGNFLAAGNQCVAMRLYLDALDQNTTDQPQAANQIAVLLPRAAGKDIPIDGLRGWENIPAGTLVTDDNVTSIAGAAMRFSAPQGMDTDVSVASRPIGVKPNQTYELSGWTRGLALYGTGYASLALYEDNGNWGASRTTPIVGLEETSGWQPFHVRFTTLPTSRRVFINAGLYRTFGTFWIDGIQLIQVDLNAPPVVTPCK